MRELGAMERVRHEELWDKLKTQPIDHYIFVGASMEVIKPRVGKEWQDKTLFLSIHVWLKYIRSLIAADLINISSSRSEVRAPSTSKKLSNISSSQKSTLNSSDKKIYVRKSDFIRCSGLIIFVIQSVIAAILICVAVFLNLLL
jgi:hypothetical protein